MNASPRIRLYFDILSNEILKKDLPNREQVLTLYESI